MFKCKNCKHIDDFELVFQSDYSGKKEYSVEYDSEKNVVITVNNYKFKPDLDFMNGHAACRYCGKTYIWTYS